MEATNWQEFKVRCSAISKTMASSRSNPVLTEKQTEELKKLRDKEQDKPLSKTDADKLAELIIKEANGSKVVLSDGCIEYLMEEYAYRTAGKVSFGKEFGIDQMEKGRICEGESITLLSVVEGILYQKNTERVYNEFLSGEPDIFVGDEIYKATKITDIKSCFDYPSLLKKIHTGIDNGYEYQIQGYCDITGATDGEIAYCLVDMPETMRNDYKRRLFYKGEYVTEESPEFLEKWNVLERSMMFSDIPHHKRVFKVSIAPFSEIKKQQVYDRVKVCREWLNQFHETYQKLNK